MQAAQHVDAPPARIRRLATAVAACLFAGVLLAQAPGVNIVRDRGEQFDALVKKANEYRADGALLPVEQVKQQLSRVSCSLKLPRKATRKLTDRQIWRRSQAAHVRVGWHYLCTKCEHWHQNLSGGYFITADGAIATCCHQLEPEAQYREGYLVAANENGDLLPVIEVLAANARTDVAIIRAKVSAPVTPLPLNPDAYPGDTVYCYSDPLGRSGYFSKGIVNRFYMQRRNHDESARMEVSTDWARGSSGAAVLDLYGNAIGHVSEIATAGSAQPPGTNQPSQVTSPMMVFHCAARAADVLALIKKDRGRFLTLTTPCGCALGDGTCSTDRTGGGEVQYRFNLTGGVL